ncbi:MAG: LL-diaminopimelate aminotransferase, partial [Lentisphaerae bacterium]|nr:LL-diaminopimelate aminotransferase [Lentisphaerota bacterium]
LMLQKAQVVITPGAGFGACGQGYIRISAFNDADKVREAMTRLQAALPKR